MCAFGAGEFKFVVHLSHSLILVTESSNMAPHGKELSGDLKGLVPSCIFFTRNKELSGDLKRCIVVLHEDGKGYKKIANTLKLSCSTVAKIILHFKRVGSTQNRPWVGRPKKLSACAEHHIQMLSLKDWHRSAVSIAAEIEEMRWGQPVSAQIIRHTLHQIGLQGCYLRRKPLLKMIYKKARKQFAEDMSTKHMDYWNHVLWSDEMKINLFGSDGFKHVYKDKCIMPTVKHGDGNVMVWGCMNAAGVGELYFIEGNMNSKMYCEILQQRMIPFLQKLGSRAVFQHDYDPKHTSMTTTALLKWLMVKVMEWPSMSPDLNPIEHLWGILKQKVEVRKVSNICQLHNVVMEEWKSIPVATCEALVNSMPRRERQFWIMMVATQNIDNWHGVCEY